MLRNISRSLLLTALLASLGEAAETPNVQKPKRSAKLSPSLPGWIPVGTMRSNAKDPAMITGTCNQKEAKQLQCHFYQIRFVHSSGNNDTCELFVSFFRQTFTRTSDTGKWVSREGPEGLCGVVDVTTLEPEPGQKVVEVLWTYTSHQIYTNTAGLLCDKLPSEEKETFSWKNPPVIIGSKKISRIWPTFPD